MPALDLLLSAANATLALVVVAGLAYRRRVAACIAFPAYLAFGAFARMVRWTFPGAYSWQYDVATDLLQAALGVAVAIELVARAFAILPGGLARARRLQAVVGIGALACLLLVPMPPLEGLPWAYVYGIEVVQRLAHARAWLFAACLAVATYYGVPLDRVHRDVAAGFVLWSAVMGVGAHLGTLDDVLQLCRQVVASLIYPGILTAWVVMAWAPDEETALSPTVLARLRPWRV